MSCLLRRLSQADEKNCKALEEATIQLKQRFADILVDSNLSKFIPNLDSAEN